jgi:hypothetical protein
MIPVVLVLLYDYLMLDYDGNKDDEDDEDDV